LLLEAYAFSKIGAVMLWGAIASFIAAALMAVLVGLGFWHARRTEREAPLLEPNAAAAS
jgi:cytochrome oxidase assembly protein ShyY1